MPQAYNEGFEEGITIGSDGLRIYYRDYNDGSDDAAERAPLICLAGLTRNSRDFHQLAVFLSRHPTAPRRVIAIDTRGRGLSDWDTDKNNYDLIHEAGDVLAVCGSLGITNADFVGTSRGGLILHLMSATQPAVLNKVILNDVGPEIGLEGLRLIKAYLAPRKPLPSWEFCTEALKLVHGKAFTAVDEQDWKDLAFATFREIDGQIWSDYDPAIAQAFAELDLSQPLPDMWTQFEALSQRPLMAIRGENSMLLEETTFTEMQVRNPKMTALLVTGQGHAPRLHTNGIADAILSFLEG